jgi:hypothetical protein
MGCPWGDGLFWNFQLSYMSTSSSSSGLTVELAMCAQLYTSFVIGFCDVGWHAPRRHETRLGAAPLLAHCRVPSSFACGGSLPSQLESELVFACCRPVSRPWTSLACPPADGTADKFAVASSTLRRMRGMDTSFAHYACGGSLPSQLESELVFACCCPVSRPWTSLGCPPAGGTADKFAVASSALRRTRGVEGANECYIWRSRVTTRLAWCRVTRQ